MSLLLDEIDNLVVGTNNRNVAISHNVVWLCKSGWACNFFGHLYLLYINTLITPKVFNNGDVVSLHTVTRLKPWVFKNPNLSKIPRNLRDFFIF